MPQKPTDPAKKPVLRDKNGHFIKGSGTPNPGGRPKAEIAKYAELARQWLPQAFEALGRIAIGEKLDGMRSAPSYRDRIAAIRELADRGLGKPVSSLELSGPDGSAVPMYDLSKLSDADLERWLKYTEKAKADGKS